ncbi:helix-turn-helix transcriptional regulator [Vibrio sp. Hep-1b-8]|uniref:helix-turn-helix transcriptional regulator n=1 Tax=Vibrio brasiliensis TaxID=170652 RepID=UPI001110A2D3|nr:transcriptional regulator [Vibrio sp. Hep-1b-8]
MNRYLPSSSNKDICRVYAVQDLKIIKKSSLADILGVSLSTVYRMIQNNELPPPLRTPKGYIRGWPESVIVEWLTHS